MQKVNKTLVVNWREENIIMEQIFNNEVIMDKKSKVVKDYVRE